MDNLADMIPFSASMGIEVIEATPDQVTARMTVRPDLCTTGAVAHGGALMALADTVGAIGAFLSMPKGANGTTTIESKTNFVAAAPEGVTVQAVATPIKTGRRLSVWQTRIETDDSRRPP